MAIAAAPPQRLQHGAYGSDEPCHTRQRARQAKDAPLSVRGRASAILERQYEFFKESMDSEISHEKKLAKAKKYLLEPTGHAYAS